VVSKGGQILYQQQCRNRKASTSRSFHAIESQSEAAHAVIKAYIESRTAVKDRSMALDAIREGV
jgi:hypothetical protein